MTALKSVVVSILVFISIYELMRALLHKVSPFPPAHHSFLYSMVTIGECLPWLVAGYVGAAINKKRGYLSGIILAPITAALQEIDCIINLPAGLHACSITTGAAYLIFGAVFASLGGLAWDFKNAWEKRRAIRT